MTTNLRDKLKQRKPREELVTIDGDEFLVIGPGRIAKNKLFAASQKNGQLDSTLLEGSLLAICVCDPATREPIMPDAIDWDIPADIAAPLVQACIKVCGLDDDEARVMGNGLAASDS